MVRMLVIVLLGALAVYFFNDPAGVPPRNGGEPEEIVTTSTGPALPEPEYRCDGREHCSQMKSCDEALFFLANCPGVKMDGDSDGRPCEGGPC